MEIIGGVVNVGTIHCMVSVNVLCILFSYKIIGGVLNYEGIYSITFRNSYSDVINILSFRRIN